MTVWKIKNLEVTDGPNELQNVVCTAHWTATLTEGEREVYSYGSVGLAYSENTPFIPFENLTEETVVSWVKGVLGSELVSDIESRLSQAIIKLSEPQTPPSLPWS